MSRILYDSEPLLSHTLSQIFTFPLNLTSIAAQSEKVIGRLQLPSNPTKTLYLYRVMWYMSPGSFIPKIMCTQEPTLVWSFNNNLGEITPNWVLSPPANFLTLEVRVRNTHAVSTFQAAEGDTVALVLQWR